MDIELGSVIAFRNWRIMFPEEGPPYLAGYAGTKWPFSTIEAECLLHNDEHDAPDMYCTCGIYGLKDQVRPTSFGLHGEVELFGKTIIHELGYRSQYGKVHKLYDIMVCSICNRAIHIYKDRYTLCIGHYQYFAGSCPAEILLTICGTCFDSIMAAKPDERVLMTHWRAGLPTTTFLFWGVLLSDRTMNQDNFPEVVDILKKMYI